MSPNKPYTFNHPLENSSYYHHKVVSQHINEITRFGPWEISWRSVTASPAAASPYHYMFQTTELVVVNTQTNFKFVDINGWGTWGRDRPPTKFPKSDWEEMWDLILADREVILSERKKRLALERKRINEEEAKEKGISLSQLMASRKTEREQKKKETDVRKSVKHVNNLMKFTTEISALQSDIAKILSILDEHPTSFKTPTSMIGFANRIHEVRRVIRNCAARNRK